MTTDSREVEWLLERLRSKTPNMIAGHAAMEAAADTIEDLLKRLEAAEAELKGTEDSLLIEIDHARSLQAALTTARAGQAEAWMAGRDAAADMPFLEGWRDLGGGMNLKQQGYWAAGFNSCRNMIRALDPPTDLSTALAEHDQRVRDAALEEAAETATLMLMTHFPAAIPKGIRALKKEPE